jgi:ABC-type glycerol-3-phosphate transport system permease component
MSGRSRRRYAWASLRYGLLGLALIYLLLPFFWMFLTSALPSSDLTSMPPKIDLSAFSFQRYGELLTDPTFLRPMWNSTVVAVSTTLICIGVGAPAAYAVARFRFPGSRAFMLTILATQMIPVIVLAVPLFVILQAIGLLDSYEGLILTYTAFILPLVIWILSGFFEDLPPSLEKAARIDGCTRLQAMVRIIMPLTATGLAATAIFAFITAWGDFFLALVLTSVEAKTLPVRTAEFQGLFKLDYKTAATAGVITSVPVLLLALAFQRYIIKGLTEGGVKG